MALSDIAEFKLQPRHTERNFRDMEPMLRVILQAYPNSVVLSLHPYSHTTFRQKFWDAVNSFCHPTVNWHSDIIKKKMIALRPMLKLTDWNVAGNAVTVMIKAPVSVAKSQDVDAPAFVPPSLDPVITLTEIDGTDKPLVWAYATIKSRNRCSDSLTLVGLTQQTAIDLEKAFGESILLIDCGNGNFNLI